MCFLKNIYVFLKLFIMFCCSVFKNIVFRRTHIFSDIHILKRNHFVRKLWNIISSYNTLWHHNIVAVLQPTTGVVNRWVTLSTVFPKSFQASSEVIPSNKPWSRPDQFLLLRNGCLNFAIYSLQVYVAESMTLSKQILISVHNLFHQLSTHS
jgi:hypothetical protein